MNDLQFISVSILLALTLVASLFTLLLKKKSFRIYGVIVNVLLFALIVYAFIRDYSFNESVIIPKQKTEYHANSNYPFELKKYNQTIQDFSKEMDSLEHGILTLAEATATDERTLETLSNKALHFREKTSGFLHRIKQIKNIPEASEIQQDFIKASEHLKLSAFALHASLSADDFAFKENQKEQVLTQIQFAKEKQKAVLKALETLLSNSYQKGEL